MNELELYHYGVKGMKWGVRRYQNADGSLTLAGKKRQAKEQYKADSRDNARAYAKSISAVDAKYQKRMSAAKNDTARSKIEKEWTDAVEKHDANWKSTGSKKDYVSNAKKQHYDDVISKNYDNASSVTKKVMDNYRSMTDQQFVNKYSVSKEKYAKRVERLGDPYISRTTNSVKKTAKALNKLGKAYLTDQIFFGGRGTRAAKAAVKTIGMASITAYTMARGGYDIEWYDKQGRRVG